MNKIIIALFIFTSNAVAEPSLNELKHRTCRNLVDGISYKLDKLQGTQDDRDNFISNMGEYIVNKKTRDLYVDVSRQYEYENTVYRKWSVAYEYCVDHMLDDAYR